MVYQFNSTTHRKFNSVPFKVVFEIQRIDLIKSKDNDKKISLGTKILLILRFSPLFLNLFKWTRGFTRSSLSSKCSSLFLGGRNTRERERLERRWESVHIRESADRHTNFSTNHHWVFLSFSDQSADWTTNKKTFHCLRTVGVGTVPKSIDKDFSLIKIDQIIREEFNQIGGKKPFLLFQGARYSHLFHSAVLIFV